MQLFTREDVPPRAFLDSDRKTIPEFVSFNAKLGVCPEARDLIEELEPGRHQFFPVEIARERGRQPIYRRDGRVLDTPYYLLNPSVRLDAVFIEKSEVKVHEFPHVTLVFPHPAREDRVVLRRSAIEGHHVWGGQHHLGGRTFFSDRLADEILRRKWRNIRFIRLREE